VKFDPQKVWANMRRASTEDLLDRVTVFRDGMEPEALRIIETELQARGVTMAAIAAHGQAQTDACLKAADGRILECSFCRKPAVARGWGWLRFFWGFVTAHSLRDVDSDVKSGWYHFPWATVPIWPRRIRFCRSHLPDRHGDDDEEEWR
jgi:hypothetical protein